MVCLSKTYHFKFFKDCLPRNLLSPLLNTLSHMFGYYVSDMLKVSYRSAGLICLNLFKVINDTRTKASDAKQGGRQSKVKLTCALLGHFMSLLFFLTPWKHQKTFDCLKGYVKTLVSYCLYYQLKCFELRSLVEVTQKVICLEISQKGRRGCKKFHKYFVSQHKRNYNADDLQNFFYILGGLCF